MAKAGQAGQERGVVLEAGGGAFSKLYGREASGIGRRRTSTQTCERGRSSRGNPRGRTSGTIENGAEGGDEGFLEMNRGEGSEGAREQWTGEVVCSKRTQSFNDGSLEFSSVRERLEAGSWGGKAERNRGRRVGERDGGEGVPTVMGMGDGLGILHQIGQENEDPIKSSKENDLLPSPPISPLLQPSTPALPAAALLSCRTALSARPQMGQDPWILPCLS